MKYLLDCKRVPNEDLRAYRTLLYAESGVGKTTWASESDVLILDFEGGTRAMSCTAIDLTVNRPPDPSLDATEWSRLGTWARFLLVVDDLCSLAATNRGSLPLAGIAVDTIDRAYDEATSYMCQKHGWKELDDAGPYGRGYSMVLEEVRRAVDRLDSLGGLLFLAHAKDREIKARGQQPYSKITPAMPPSACRWLLGACDLVLYGEVALDVEGAEVRIVHTQPSHRFDAKARGRRDTPLPSPLPLDYTAFASAFSAAMNGEAIASTITLAAAEPAVAPTPAGPNPWNE